MKVVRINSYQDKRFSPKVLNQHGAFLVDDTYSCEFGIIDDDTAIIKYHDLNNIDIIIDKFRFYAEHPIEQMWIEISKIQPSQFYISKDKVIINNESDVIIPLEITSFTFSIAVGFLFINSHLILFPMLAHGLERIFSIWLTRLKVKIAQ